MQIRLYTCACVLAIIAAAPPAHAQFRAPAPVAPGEDYHFEFAAMSWTPTPEIGINTNDLGILGNEVDFVQEFDLEDKRFTEFRVTVKPGRQHKIRFHYVPMTYSADAVLERTIEFAGRTFDVGIPATADVEWHYWRFGYEWDFISRQNAFVGFLAELKHNRVSADIDTPFGGASGDATAPVPSIGVIGRGYFTKSFSGTAEFSGFKMFDTIVEDFDGWFWDFDIYATYNIGRNVGVQGGYRSLDVEYVAPEDLGHLKMKGYYFGGIVRF